MEKFILPTIGLLASLLAAQAQYFSPTNLVAVQQTTSGNGAAVAIVQMQTNGTLVSSTNLPSGGANAFVLSTSTTEGFITLSANGEYLVLGGYNTTPAGTISPASATSTNVPRAVATLDAYDNYALPISNPNIYSTYNIRGAVSDGLGNYWVSGSGGTGASIANGELGIIYVGTATQPTNITVSETGTGNERCLDILNGALYLSTGSSTHGIFMISNVAGTYPKATGSTANNTNVIPMNSSSGPYAFQINTAGTLAYVAEDNLGGIVKFTSAGPGGVWTSNYTIPVWTTGTAAANTNAYGCAVDFSQNPAVIYATTSETPANRLVRIVDTGASATATAIATAPAGTVWRGVRFGPGAYPTITTNVAATLVVDAGQTATFTVAAIGTPTLTYQWYSNSVANPAFVAILSATNCTLSLTNTTAGQSNSMFYVVVSNAYGTAQSTSATLTVDPPGPPANIQVTPGTQTVNAGSVAVFNATFVGATTSLSYGWTLNGAPLTDGKLGGSTISGSATPTLTISNAFAIDDGGYVIAITNSLGHDSSGPGVLQVNDPAILTSVMGATNLPGSGPVGLSVSASGTGLTFQWLSNGVAITGATSATYTVPNSASAVWALYSVIVSNAAGASVTNGPTVVSYSPLLLNETFPYANGNLFGDPGSPWTDINGTNPEIVTNGRAQISQSNATTDAQSLFSQPEGNNVMWASFIINLRTLPTNAGGVYFANLEDTNFNFFGRIFTLTSNQPGFTPNIPSVAFPGTYRLGIADAQGDSTGTSTTGPNAVVPLDLAPGIDYQVVFFVDFGNGYSSMAVNPASLDDVEAYSPGGVCSGPTTDSFSPSGGSTQYTNQLMNAFGMRQRQGEGVMQIDNIQVAFDWSDSGSGYAAVTAGMTHGAPVIGLQPVGTTNYSGNPFTMEVAASGIGASGAGLTYAWYQNGGRMSDNDSVTGSSTATLTFNSLADANDGTYYVVVQGSTGGPVESSITVVLVNSTATAPTFTVQPASYTTNSEGGSVSLSSLAVGTGPITYAWYCSNSTGISQVGSGANLTLSELNTNESGTYYAVATGDNGQFQTQSSNAVLVVNGPVSTTIGYLRSLLNPTTYQPSDPNTHYTVTGVITTATNQTTGNTASYYIQDSTGGLNLFVTFGSDFRPELGDLVTATGVLSTYVDNYELDVSEGSEGYQDVIVSKGNPLPTPILLQWGYTAPLPANIATNVEGSVVMLTNLYFAAYIPGTTNLFASGKNYVVTNQAGQSYTVFVSDQDTGFVTGQPIPQFAASIAGPLIQDNTTVGISFTVYTNLVVGTSASPTPPPMCPTACLTGAAGSRSVTLAWTALPNTCTYGVWTATNLLGPWTNIASGLSFGTTNGTYCDTAPTNMARFYQIVSP